MPHPSHSTDRAILFANPHSGRGRRWLWKILRQCQLQHIELAAVHFDVSQATVERALQAAEQAGIQAVLVAGGDGTVGTIAAHIVKTPFALGVIPAGTSNDFARSLDVPMDVAGAVRVIVEGRLATVDVGCAGDRIFAHAAIIGINTDFARRAQSLRRWVGRLSYPIAAVEVYRHRKPFELRVTADGREEHFEAFEAAFVNAPAYGGPLGLEVAEADLVDRHVGVVVVTDMTWKTIALALPNALTHRSLQLPGIDMFSVRSARVDTAEPMPMTIDGEIEGSTPATIKSIPAALQVFVPECFLARSEVH